MRIKISEIKEGAITPIPGTDCFAVKMGARYTYTRTCAPTPIVNSPWQDGWKARS
jgi:hypothetical protein